ncbi:MAG: TetR family transcriptional regulator [Alphaproteobacteria bacterium]|nr:MAG: TetR family transcriptional regulator [Alphaproteobacteria bacterium]
MQQLDTARARQTKKRTRIQEINSERILDAALEVFSEHGFRGATVDEIAERAGMSKPNLHYYFRRKKDLYLAVLGRTLEMWLKPLEEIRPDGEPELELRRYIEAKVDMSRQRPQESRLFASEILHGAPMLRPLLETRVRDLVDEKAAVLRRWAEAGRLAPVDPYHLIFMIWAVTQHYADFATQICAVKQREQLDDAFFDEAKRNVYALLREGLFGRGRAP